MKNFSSKYFVVLCLSLVFVNYNLFSQNQLVIVGVNSKPSTVLEAKNTALHASESATKYVSLASIYYYQGQVDSSKQLLDKALSLDTINVCKFIYDHGLWICPRRKRDGTKVSSQLLFKDNQ